MQVRALVRILCCDGEVQAIHPTRGTVMDVIESLVRAGLLIGFLILVIVAVAALFMVVFGIATGIDEKIQS
jgi:hypothetical protein